jgi:tetratricopeptide (TPR) repeat protein
MKKIIQNNILRSNIFIFSLILISGCGFWGNFKTYFNTYYNANKIFTETEAEIKTAQTKLFYFEEDKITQPQSKKFDEVIEKTSAIMQYNKDSGYFEDAILMTGKSFYYQQNYSRALRKFNELAAIPESELALENNLWIAKTHLQLRDFTKAMTKFDEVKKTAIAENDQDILNEVFKSKIGYLIYDEDYEEATSEIKAFLATDISNELRSGILYELGVLYVKLENYKDAESTFMQTQDYSPTPEIEFSSRFELAKLQKVTGNNEKSLEFLDGLRNEDKFADSLDRIDLAIGKIKYESGDIDGAYDNFTDVDTTFKNTEASGIASFYRAEILENYFHNYDSSLTLYKNSMNSKATQDIKEKAKNKTIIINKYLDIHNQLKKLEKDYEYITDNQSYIKDSIDYVDQVRIDSVKRAEETEQNVRTDKRVVKKNAPKFIKPVRPKISVDSIHVLNCKSYFELANLFFTEFNIPDSAYKYYKLSLAEKEENPNQAQTYYALGNYYLFKKDKPKADSMFTLVYEKFPFNPIRNEAAKQIGKPLYDFNKDPVEDEYSVAENLFDSENYKKAVAKLFEIYKNHPSSIYASKSLYTIGYILENKLDLPDSAASIYDTLFTKYRNTDYTKAILVKLNGHKQKVLKEKAVQDSILNANKLKLENSKTEEKVSEKNKVLDNIPKTAEETKDSVVNSNNQAVKKEPLEK